MKQCPAAFASLTLGLIVLFQSGVVMKLVEVHGKEHVVHQEDDGV